MATGLTFTCHKSVMDGWVASGTITGVAGGTFEERPVWFGCQGASWLELQAGMRKLAKVLAPRLEVNAMATPIEAFVKVRPEDEPLLIPPTGLAEHLFNHLIEVGSRRRAWAENVDGVRIISFLKIGALAVLKPDTEWKPELVSSFLGFANGLVPEHPTPAPERAGQTSADLVEEILLGARD